MVLTPGQALDSKNSMQASRYQTEYPAKSGISTTICFDCDASLLFKTAYH